MIGPVLKNGLEIKMTGGIASRPYIDLTLWMMREFGADADWSDSETLKVNPHPYEQHKYLIESDWSASSYWYEMMTLAEDPESMVMFDGLFDASKQGDSIVKYIFSLMGVKTLLAEILNVGTEITQRIHQYLYRTLLHALRSRDGVLARRDSQISRHETHGGSCSLDVYGVRLIHHGVDNHLRVVADRQVLRQHVAFR